MMNGKNKVNKDKGEGIKDKGTKTLRCPFSSLILVPLSFILPLR